MNSGTEVLIRQGENLKAILSKFDISESDFANGVFTQQQNINDYVTGKRCISEKKEEDITTFLKQKYDFDLNPGFVRGLNDRMKKPRRILIEETGIAKKVAVEDIEGMIAEESEADAEDDSVLSLLSALGYSFTVSGVSQYDIRVNGRIVCESVSGDKVFSMIDEVIKFAEKKAKSLIKHSKT